MQCVTLQVPGHQPFPHVAASDIDDFLGDGNTSQRFGQFEGDGLAGPVALCEFQHDGFRDPEIVPATVVTGNTGTGLLLSHNSIANFNSASSISGNGGSEIFCFGAPSTVVGNITGVTEPIAGSCSYFP